MIITASRRTDIPAFYSEWFANRIREGYLYARNPRFGSNISRIILRPDLIDCIVFVTKNPANMLGKLDMLEKFNYLFQYTLNPYGPDMESGLPDVDTRIKSFVSLSRRLGKRRTIWRYDPILLSRDISVEFHKRSFDHISGKLEGQTEKCIVSFVDMYRSARARLERAGVRPPDLDEMREIAACFAPTALNRGIRVTTCAESLDLDEFGVSHGKCVDHELISNLFGLNLRSVKHKPLRKDCACAESIDIGDYNTCRHNCLYCYANFSRAQISENVSRHRSNSPLLIGGVTGCEKIFEKGSRKESNQVQLF